MILVTHDRYFLDQVTEWTLELDRGKGIPYEGNYSAWLEQKEKRLERKSARTPRASARGRGKRWFAASPGPPFQVQGAPRGLRRNGQSKARRPTIAQIIAGAARLGPRHRGRRPGEGIRRQGAVQQAVVQAAARRHRRRHRAERRRQVDAVPLDHRPGEAGRGIDQARRAVQLAYVDQSRDALDSKKTVWEEISGGLDIIKVGNREITSRAYVGASTSRAATSRRRSASSPAASATACTWPRPCGGRQRHPARRTDQRPRHRDPPGLEEALETSPAARW